MQNNINIIFPMAGDGLRFGGTDFKPFIDGTEKLFIELAKEPFNILKKYYNTKFIFIFRNDQDYKYNVSIKLKSLFPNDSLLFCIIPSCTNGPIETIKTALNLYDISGTSFVCDCDHSINISPILDFIQNNNNIPDIIVPIWNFKEKESENWAKVKFDLSFNLISYHEKDIIPFSSSYNIKGIIGCYLFKNINILSSFTGVKNMTDILQCINNIKFINIDYADFFGTPEQLISFRFNLAKNKTFFIDIDGTLLYLPKYVSYDANNSNVLPGCIDKLKEWKLQGHHIVLTTGRVHDKRELLEKQLKDLGIIYDQLITGLNPGPRILINDKKPYSEIHKMAIAFQLKRNHGISNIVVDDTPTIIKQFKGASFANVYLINKNDQLFVRKYIEKNNNLQAYCDTLRRQYEDLKRLSYYSPNLIPILYNFFENENEVYYDMEYLNDYLSLYNFSDVIIQNTLQDVINKLTTDVYCYNKQIDGLTWFNHYVNEKIISKYSFIETIDNNFKNILNSDEIIINNNTFKGIKYFFNNNINTKLYPHSVSPIHGDLTLENIMFNQIKNEFRLIDTDGSRYVDIREMDFAKLFQSLIAKYESWDFYLSQFIQTSNNSFEINPDILIFNFDTFKYLFENYDEHEKIIVFKRSIFILGTYFIRMIPYLIKKSKQHALFGLILASYFISYE